MFSFLKRKEENEWLNGYGPEYDRFSPDYYNLSKKMWCRLFVYNDWQDNQANSKLLGEDAIKCAAAFTKNNQFVVMKKKLGKETFPFALLMDKPEHKFGRETFLGVPGQVMGQVFLVRPQTIKSLDELVLNGVQFDRQRIDVEVPYRDKEGTYISGQKVMEMPCWAYIGRKDFWIEGHEINEVYCGKVRHFATVRTHLNEDKESKVYYYYNDKFEINP